MTGVFLSLFSKHIAVLLYAFKHAWRLDLEKMKQLLTGILGIGASDRQLTVIFYGHKILSGVCSLFAISYLLEHPTFLSQSIKHYIDVPTILIELAFVGFFVYRLLRRLTELYESAEDHRFLGYQLVVSELGSVIGTLVSLYVCLLSNWLLGVILSFLVCLGLVYTPKVKLGMNLTLSFSVTGLLLALDPTRDTLFFLLCLSLASLILSSFTRHLWHDRFDCLLFSKLCLLSVLSVRLIDKLTVLSAYRIPLELIISILMMIGLKRGLYKITYLRYYQTFYRVLDSQDRAFPYIIRQFLLFLVLTVSYSVIVGIASGSLIVGLVLQLTALLDWLINYALTAHSLEVTSLDKAVNTNDSYVGAGDSIVAGLVASYAYMQLVLTSRLETSLGHYLLVGLLVLEGLIIMIQLREQKL